MASNNMVTPAVNPDIEDDLFQKEVQQVKDWWRDSRWRHTKRPFTAEQIVTKRGHLKIEYPSNAQAKKLWNILENRFQVSHTQCSCIRSHDCTSKTVTNDKK
jgi:isocitrate lyase